MSSNRSGRTRGFPARMPGDIDDPPAGYAYLYLNESDWCFWMKRSDKNHYLVGPHAPVLTVPEIRAALGAPNRIMKAADQPRPNSTMAADSALTFAAAANTKYRFRLEVYFSTGALAGFKFALTAPASPTYAAFFHQVVAPGAIALSALGLEVTLGQAITPSITGNGSGVVLASGTIHNGANAGTVAFSWAQAATNASAAIVRAGSLLEWESF